MKAKLPEDITALKEMSGQALRARYFDLFGDATHVGDRTWLIRRFTWRLQARSRVGSPTRCRAS